MSRFRITEEQMSRYRDIKKIREGMKMLGALITEELILEDKRDILMQKYVANEKQLGKDSPEQQAKNAKKITPQQFDAFYNAAMANPQLSKYADPLLTIVVNSPNKDRFFNDRDYEHMMMTDGLLARYNAKLPVIKAQNPEYVNLLAFKTIDNFKKYMAQFSGQTPDVQGQPQMDITTQDVKLKKAGIEIVGSVDGYRVYEIDQHNTTDLEAMWQAYRSIICSGKTNFCTASNFETFKTYLSKDNLFLFVNPADPKAPYQFHYADNQFMDRNDNSII